MAPLVVARLVPDHAGQLVIRLHEIEQALVDVDVASADGERVDDLRVENLDVVGDVLARDLAPQFIGDAVDPLVEQRIRDNVVLR